MNVAHCENKSEARILVVDDEPLERESLHELLSRCGYKVATAEDGEEALAELKNQQYDVVIADIRMPRLDGMDLLREIIREGIPVKTILITGHEDIRDAVQAMKLGAYYYIPKPVQDEELILLVQRAFEHQSLILENDQLRQKLDTRQRFHKLVGQNQKMRDIYKLVENISNSNASVLIEGESGTGKELVAEAIHENSPRKNSQFVKVNCGSLPESLLESEMFGHMRGAFTSAFRDKIGRFEYANGGTLFLDEIDTFSSALQVKLLRVLQEQQFERVGGNHTVAVDVRIIAASNRDLQQAVQDGEFRLDLYYRLNVIQIKIPPLRERMDDLPLLIDHFLQKYNESNGKKIKTVSPEAMRLMETYDWPGNVRELENVIERAVVLEQSSSIQAETLHLPNMEREQGSMPHLILGGHHLSKLPSLKEGIQIAERELILVALQANNWRRQRTAEALGINRITLYNKMRQYDIQQT